MKRLLIFLFVCFFSQAAWAGLEMGRVPSKVELKDKSGGRLDGTPWNSEELKGKVYVLFYVDPDQKDLNNETSEALNEAKFARKEFQSVAVINMAATWLPNFAISSSLKEKQKRYPNTIYVRDFKKVLVHAWGLSDDNSDVLAFDRQGQLIFRKDGKLNSEEIQALLKTIRDHLNR